MVESIGTGVVEYQGYRHLLLRNVQQAVVRVEQGRQVGRLVVVLLVKKS